MCRRRSQARRGDLDRSGGEGLRLLTGPITSPTNLQADRRRCAGAIRGLLWHVHDPLEDRRRATGGRSWPSAGRSTRCRGSAEADVLVTLDADPLGPGPAQIVNGARLCRTAGGCGSGTSRMGRLYAFEAAPTLTGAKADHRLTLAPRDIAGVAVALARALGAELADPGLPADRAKLVEAVAARSPGAYRPRAGARRAEPAGRDPRPGSLDQRQAFMRPSTYLGPVGGRGRRPRSPTLVERPRSRPRGHAADLGRQPGL